MAKKLPTLDADPQVLAPDAGPARVSPGNGPLSRRGFVSAATWSLVTGALLEACGGGGDTTGPSGDTPRGGNPPGGNAGIVIAGNRIVISLAQVQELAAADGFRLISEASTVVINVGNDQFRAFTSICTHQQCNVSSYAGRRLVCPCHNSQFDRNGQVVVGPATAPLQEFTTAYNAATRTLTVTKS